MTFSFHHLKVDYKNGDKWSLMAPDFGRLKQLFADWQEQMTAGGGWNALFWCNHDQPRIVSRFGDDKKYWEASAKMLAAAIHFMRGTPYIYQGEELGMTNAGFASIDEYRDVESINYYKILRDAGHSEAETLKIIGERSRDNGRMPMQWTAGENAGFTTGTPWIAVNKNHTAINAEREAADPGSIRAFYKQLVRLRKELPIIAEGDVRFLEPENNDVLAYERTLGDKKLRVLCNLRGTETKAPLADYRSSTPHTLLSNYPGENRDALRPYEVVVLTN